MKKKPIKAVKVHRRDFVDMAMALGFVPHPMMSPHLHIPKTVIIRKTMRANEKERTYA